MLWLFYRLRWRAVSLLPPRYRLLFQPLCLAPPGSLVVNASSVLLGSWTHLLWDSLTHKDGWLVGHLPILHFQVAFLANHSVRVCHLLWYVSSFVGIAWLVLVYTRWLRDTGPRATVPTTLSYAILVPLVLVPVELMRHLKLGGFGIYVAAAFTLLLMVVVIRCLGPGKAAEKQPSASFVPPSKSV